MRHWLFLLLALPSLAFAGQATEIVYEDMDPGALAYTSRILIQDDRMRMDYGKDQDDFILYDRNAGMIYQVAHSAARITQIPSGPSKQTLPKGWRLGVTKEGTGANRLTRLKLNDRLCVEYRSAKLLREESRLIRDFRRALSGIQATTWQATPEELRDPCALVLDVVQAGLEYGDGLPLLIRYSDGRSRVYRSHGRREVRAELFELPPGYQRFTLENGASAEAGGR